LRKIEKAGWASMIIFTLLGSVFLIFALSHLLSGESEIPSMSAWIFGTIPGVASAIAAFYTYQATKRAAVATENASEAANASVVAASFEIRQEVLKALVEIWAFLNKKSCAWSYNPSSPEKFLITSEELLLLESHRKTIFFKSRIFGPKKSEEIIEFYTYLVSKLESQSRACDYDPTEGLGVNESTSKEWHEYRTKQRDRAFQILETVKHLCYLP
jgi:hypothetical protein